LERTLWKWKLAVAVGGIILAALAGMVTVIFFARQQKQMKAENAGEVIARKFVVVNEAGKTVATLGSLGDGAFVGLFLMPSRYVSPKAKEGEAIEKPREEEAIDTLAKTGGSLFGAMGDGSFIGLGARRSPPNAPPFGAVIFGGPESASLDLKAKSDSGGKAPEISLDSWSGSAGLVLEGQSANLDLEGEPDSRHRSTKISLGMFGGSEAFASVTSRSGRSVTLSAFDGIEAAKYEFPGEASVSLSEPGGDSSRVTPRQAKFTLRSDGSADLEFKAKGFRSRAGLDVDSDGSPHLDLFDNDGNLRAALGVTDLQTVRTGAQEKTAPSSLTLFDKKGKVIWQSPH
jgi:hypothetical protein